MDHQALLYLKESLYSLPLKQLLLNFHDIFQHTVASNGNVRRSYKEHLRKISLATENGRSQKGGSLPTAIQGAMLNFRAVGHQSKPSMSIVHATRGCAFTSRHVWMTQTLQQIEVSRLSIMSKTCHEHFWGTHLPKTQHEHQAIHQLTCNIWYSQGKSTLFDSSFSALILHRLGSPSVIFWNIFSSQSTRFACLICEQKRRFTLTSMRISNICWWHSVGWQWLHCLLEGHIGNFHVPNIANGKVFKFSSGFCEPYPTLW